MCSFSIKNNIILLNDIFGNILKLNILFKFFLNIFMNLKPNKNGNKNILLFFTPKRNLLTSPLVSFLTNSDKPQLYKKSLT